MNAPVHANVVQTDNAKTALAKIVIAADANVNHR